MLYKAKLAGRDCVIADVYPAEGGPSTTAMTE